MTMNLPQTIREKTREERGRDIALTKNIYKTGKYVYRVESEDKPDEYYTVLFIEEQWFQCDCPDWTHRFNKDDRRYFMCKHCWALAHAITLGSVIDATEG